MANQRRGIVQMELGGETYSLRMGFNAIAELEQLHGGTPIHQLMSAKFGMGLMRDAIYVAIVDADPKLAQRRRITRERVGELLSEDIERFDEILEKLLEVIGAGMPGVVQQDPRKPAPADAVVAVAAVPATPAKSPDSTGTSSSD